MNHLQALSDRGKLASTAVLRIDFDVYFEASKNLYDPSANPNGTLPLNIAENKLMSEVMQAKIESIMQTQSIPDWVPYYTSSLGDESFRKALSGFFEKNVCHIPIDFEKLAVSSGATGVVEMTSWMLANSGDVAVFPAPCYPVYKQDIGNKAGVERYDLQTHHDLEEIMDGLVLSRAALDRALADINSQGKKMSMLVLTTPDNPSGAIYSNEQLEMAAQWCMDRKVHLIVNEIYFLSKIDLTHSEIRRDYKTKDETPSFAQIMAQHESPYLHMWYALSKDFGVSGYRVGVMHSHNPELIKAYDNFNAPHLVSNHTQWLFAEILADQAFVESYIAENQKRLTASYVCFVKAMRALNIPYTPSKGSLFIWIDLSRFLEDDSQPSEDFFWEDLYNQTGILLTPGQGFGHAKKGLFRVVYPCVSLEHLEVALERFGGYLRGSKKF